MFGIILTKNTISYALMYDIIDPSRECKHEESRRTKLKKAKLLISSGGTEE